MSQHPIGRQAMTGMAWSIFATGGGRLISLASIAILARLLTPTHFGLVAFALVVIAYVEAVGDLGTSAALIRWPERWREVAQVTFAINVMMGAMWLALTVVAAPAIARFFGSADGVPVLRALAWAFVIKGLGNTHDALLQRELRFQARAIPEVSLLVVKAAVAIPLAFEGFGAWSLVWGQLVGQAVWTVLLWVLVPWRPARTMPSATLVRQVFGFGRGIVSVNVLAALVHHVDVVVIGRAFGAATLGLYQMAEKLPDLAITLVTRSASKVLFPVFGRLQAGADGLRDMYTTSLRYLSLLTTPAAIALMLLAEPIVLTVLGPPWRPAVPILRALAAYAGIRALSASAGDVLKAVGRPGALAALAAVRAVVLVPALILATAMGPVAVAWTLAAVTTVATITTIAFVSRVATIPLSAILEALRPGFGAGAVLAASLVIAMRWTASVPPLLQLIAASMAGIAAYVIALRVISPATWREVRRIVTERRQRIDRTAASLAGAEAQ
jgi:O-antigen/teichoic acid export membrane protein